MRVATGGGQSVIVSRGRAWSIQQRAELTELAANGLTAPETARWLRRAESEVRAEVWRLRALFDLTSGHWTKAEEERFIQLAGEHSYAEIALDLGRSAHAVRAKGRDLGLAWVSPRTNGRRVNGPRFSGHEDRRLLDGLRRRWTVREIGRKF